MVGKETAKGLLAMGVVVGMFGGLFAAINNYALAANMDTVTTIPTTYQEYAGGKEAATDYVKANYTVIETLPISPVNNYEYAISADEAAELGAQYLWDMFGIDLEGKVIQMTYYTDPSRAIPYWDGNVFDSEAQLEDDNAFPEVEYTFSIEAITGARNMATDDISFLNREPVIAYDETKTLEYYQNHCEEFLEAAKIYAAKQMDYEPVLAEFDDISVCYPVLENGSDSALASYVLIVVMVTDVNGNQTQVWMDTADMSLWSINSIYQGVNYDPDSLG